MTTSTISAAESAALDAAVLRQEASASFQRAQDSFDRCDTDGFVSQWASDMTGRLKERQADIVEAGGVARFLGLFDAATGERIPAKLIDGKFGRCWALVTPGTDRFTGQFISNSGRPGETPHPRSALAKAGMIVDWEIAPAWARIDAPKGARGLGGATQCFIHTYRKDDGTGQDPRVRRDVDDTDQIATDSVDDSNGVGVEATPTGKASTSAVARPRPRPRFERVTRTAPEPATKTRPSWAEVLEANEWFDGEPEITAQAKAAWLDGRYDR